MTVTSGRTQVLGIKWLFIDYAVNVIEVDHKERAKFISHMQTQNLSIKSKVKHVFFSWLLMKLKRGKMLVSLFLEVETPGRRNNLVQESLLHDKELLDCDLII